MAAPVLCLTRLTWMITWPKRKRSCVDSRHVLISSNQWFLIKCHLEQLFSEVVSLIWVSIFLCAAIDSNAWGVRKRSSAEIRGRISAAANSSRVISQSFESASSSFSSISHPTHFCSATTSTSTCITHTNARIVCRFWFIRLTISVSFWHDSRIHLRHRCLYINLIHVRRHLRHQ